jgi:hypothetical protein
MLQLAEKAKIRLYLGYPDEMRYANTRLEGCLTTISDEAVDQVRSLLTSIAAVDTLIATVGLANLGLSRVDEIWFQKGNVQINQQRQAGRIFIGQLSIILGVPRYSDYYGSQGYLGDSFSGLGGANGSRHYNVG